MDSGPLRESRRILRRVQDHLYQAHTDLGVKRISLGLMEVIHHPESTLGSLNYVTPRRKTAWVANDPIQQALEHLKALDRLPRVQYIEGLYLPLFAKTLLDLGLQAEWELPLMVYARDGYNDIVPDPPQITGLRAGVRVAVAQGESGIALWRRLWRDSSSDVLLIGAEPLRIGEKTDTQFDMLLYEDDSPTGIARVTIHDQTAHIGGMGLLAGTGSLEHQRALQAAATRAALERGCTLVYTPGQTDTVRQFSRENGFLDFGSVVSYAAEPETDNATQEEQNASILGQPVLALR